MLTAQVEDWNGGPADLRSLIPLHYEDLSLHKGRGFPLSPQWGVYGAKDTVGGLTYCTLRRDGLLIGYIIIFLAPGLHYDTCLTGMTDIFFISPGERGGTGALKLFSCAEREMKRRKCKLWIVGSKVHKPASERLLKAKGFEPADLLWHKWLEAPQGAKVED